MPSTIRPPHLKRETSDVLLGKLVSSLPLQWQYYFRDNMFRGVCDNAVTLSAFLMALSQPHVAFAFMRTSLGLRVYYYGNLGSNQYVEVLNINQNQGPVVLFVHGGAWGSGKPWMYRLAARGLGEALGASSVVLVGYDTYPDATITEQVECLRRARLFVHQSRRRLGIPDDADMILAGHSSGANLCALIIQDESRLCRGLILFSGVFDIYRHYLFESERGLQNISPMFAASEGLQGLKKHSPTVLLQDGNWGGGQHRKDRYIPPTLIVHYTDDDTVPFTSSNDMAYVLRSLGGPVNTAFLKGSHVGPIIDLMHPVVAIFQNSEEQEKKDNRATFAVLAGLLRDFPSRMNECQDKPILSRTGITSRL